MLWLQKNQSFMPNRLAKEEGGAKVADNDGASKQDAAAAALKAAQPELMRGVTKGVLHKNTASRKMSRLSSRVKAIG